MSLIDLFNKSPYETMVGKDNNVFSMSVSHTRHVRLDEIEVHEPTGCLMVEGVLVATDCGYSFNGKWITYAGKFVCPSYDCYLRKDTDKKVWNLFINNRIVKSCPIKDGESND